MDTGSHRRRRRARTGPRSGATSASSCALIRVHPKDFFIAVCGAAVFAICTIASSFAIGWVIDQRDPAALRGRRAWPPDPVIAGIAMVIGIGILRAIGVVVRRSYAGIVMWHVAQTYTNEVVGRLRAAAAQLARPAPRRRSRPAGRRRRRGIGRRPRPDPVRHLDGPDDLRVDDLAVLDRHRGSASWRSCCSRRSSSRTSSTNGPCRRTSRRAQDQLGEFSAGVHESFEGVQLVKSYGAEERETDRLAGLAERVRA